MQKNSSHSQWSVRTLVFMALLVAMHLVLTRVLVIELGPNRISVGSVCTILAGIWLGPVAGGVCGLAADLIGCFMKGYAINPLITISAMLWGIIPGLMKPLFTGNKSKAVKTAFLSLTIIITAIFSSLIFNTAGLVLIMGYNFYAIMPGRLVQFVIMIPIYCVLTTVMYFSPLTAMIAENAAPGVLKKKIV